MCFSGDNSMLLTALLSCRVKCDRVKGRPWRSSWRENNREDGGRGSGLAVLPGATTGSRSRGLGTRWVPSGLCLAYSRAPVSPGAEWGRRHLQPGQQAPPSPQGPGGQRSNKGEKSPNSYKAQPGVGSMLASLSLPSSTTAGPAPPPWPSIHTPGHRRSSGSLKRRQPG